jgi:hypothetical protein
MGLLDLLIVLIFGGITADQHLSRRIGWNRDLRTWRTEAIDRVAPAPNRNPT